MLSAKYHAHHWLMSVGAINAYDMFVPKSEDFNGRLFLYPLLAYAAYTVLAGPRPPLWRSLASYISVAYNVVATGWLMVWLGIVADDYALRRTYLGRFTRTMVHAILAFNVMCAFDSIGQNRRDIDQTHITNIWCNTRLIASEHADRLLLSLASLRQQLYFLCTFFGVVACLAGTINALLYKLNGPGTTCATIWESHMDHEKATFIDAVVFFLIVGTFLDIAETMLFVVCKVVRPVWVPSERYLSRGSWTPLNLNVVASAPLWATLYALKVLNYMPLRLISWKMPFV